MPSRKTSSKPPAKSADRPSPQPRPTPGQASQANPPEVVDPVWLIKALAICFLAALFCAWLTACLLYYQGEWQLVLHPTHSLDQTPANAGVAFEPIHFDAAVTGQPRLTAWWIPAQDTLQPGALLSFQNTPKYAAYTILYLHDGTGSLSASVPALARLHQAGINIFAIDYRGFGLSENSAHPTEAHMTEDTAAALDYLTGLRHIPAGQIVPYGVGLGAALAANLAKAHLELPAVILDNPDPDPTATAVAARPSHIIPVRLLFRERFDIAGPLATLQTPKLLIAGGPNSASVSHIAALEALFRHAASPHLTYTLRVVGYEKAYQTALSRFLDQYLPPVAPH